ncbi:aminoacyl-tRNA hydrolase [bacterium]|nr:aminoacyl-tRNA hydrolase [bacterium]MBT3903732.1 aminoacyl-tRNA hydrolase [bacterium]MBT4578036.1 aminoacyl-tRNA hydrolase [bacterium]MBT5346199.1 aminoacyl-tRNA hydrolase [bacterium]MBT6130995.1 aminoacyl-tRNA hydrolase [bacterium]
MNNEKIIRQRNIRLIVGLGNPGPRFEYTHHNIGFLVLDELAHRLGASWKSSDLMEVAVARLGDRDVWLVKPQTFMNDSGKVLKSFFKQGVQQEQVLIVHDELDLEFGLSKWRVGGSARGHNGIRSMIEYAAPEAARLRVGVSRPARREDVHEYVLQRFKQSSEVVEKAIFDAAQKIEDLFQSDDS